MIRECAKHPDNLTPRVCVTAQHRVLLDQVLSIFTLTPDYDLDIMRDGQSSSAVTARMLVALEEVLREERLAARPDVEIVFPVHPNPQVRRAVEPLLGGLENVHLVAPLDYVSFVGLMGQAWIAITDSGGVQEEAPSLGLPVLVLREKTERPEAVEAGTVRLVGTDEERIVREAALLLDEPEERARRSAVHNPYGDGQASRRIVRALGAFLNNRAIR